MEKGKYSRQEEIRAWASKQVVVAEMKESDEDRYNQ